MNSRRYNDIAIALVALAVTAVYLTMPRGHDDYWYMADVAQYGLGGCIRHHCLTDNARLCNMVGAAIINLPQWLLALASGLTVWLGLKAMVRLAGASAAVAPAAILVAAYILVIPWTDLLFTSIFSISYIWSWPLMAAGMLLFMSPAKKPWWVALGYGLLLGAWHEIFSVPVLVGAVCCMAIHRRMTRSDRLWLCLGLFLGGLWLWCSPSRTAPDGYGGIVSRINYSRSLIPHTWPMLLLLAAEAAALVVRPSRKAALHPVMIFAASACGISAAVYLLSHALRVMVPGILMAAVGLVWLAYHISNPGRSRKWTLWAATAVYIFLLTHLAVAFATGLQVGRECREITRQYMLSKDTDGVVFASVTTPYTAPALALGKPCLTLFEYFSHPALFGRYNGGEMLRVIPPQLRHYDGSGTPVDGDTDFRLWHGCYVSPASGRLPDHDIILCLTFPDGSVSCNNFGYNFTASDGKRYFWLHTHGRHPAKIHHTLPLTQ